MEAKEYLVHVAVKTTDSEFDCQKLKGIMLDLGYCSNMNAGDNGTWSDGNIDTKACAVVTAIHFEGYGRAKKPSHGHARIVDAIRKAHETGISMLFDTPTVETEWTETEPQHSYTT